jgi:2-iminobutanoate/2-iminopropanoate deaminase
MAGQVGLDPSTGAFAPGGFEGQFRQIMKNIAALASTAGSNLSRVVNMTVYLTDERDFSLLNALYSELVPGPVFPARTTVIVKALPLDAVVEATAILLSSK